MGPIQGPTWGPHSANPLVWNPIVDPVGWSAETQRQIEQQAAGARLQGGYRAPDVGAAERRWAAEEARVLREQRIREDRDRVRDSLLGAIAAHDDPIERLLLAMRHWVPDVNAYNPLNAYARSLTRKAVPTTASVPPESIDQDLWRSAFPEYWEAGQEVRLSDPTPPWSAPLTARWFARRANAVKVRPTWKTYGFCGFQRSAWTFDASTWHDGSMNGQSPAGPETLIVLRSGRLYHPTGNIGLGGLQQMARLLNLVDQNMQPGP